MKKIITVICVYAFLIIPICCKKDASEKNNNNSIEGIWELRQVSGQIGVINYEPNNGNQFDFTSNGFQKFTSGVVVDSGTYSLKPDTTASENVCLVLAKDEFNTRIEFNNIEQPKQFIQISNDSLYFLSGCFANDGGSGAVYVKKTYLY